MSEQVHDADDREYTNLLIEESEFSKYSDTRKVQKTALNDLSEAIMGWKPAETALKQGGTTGVKKRKVIERTISDLHYGSGNASQSDEFWSNNSSSADYKVAVRRVGDDFKTFPVPPWKSNIEQGTYRYIPNNGSYRTLKFMFDDRKEWYTIRKKHPEIVSASWQQNCKRMQREMKRQLKKDLHNYDKDTRSSISSKESSRKSAEPEMSGDESSRSNVDTSEHIHNHKTLKHSREVLEFERSAQPEVSPRRLYRTEKRIRSTQSDGAVNYAKAMNTIPESEPATPMPQYSIPSGGQMFKSASDLFVENFSTRISALEDEIKKDSKWLRKNENEHAKLQNSRSKYREQTRSNFKENGIHNPNLTPRMPLKTETLTSDIFSVKPMGQKELKPLEKTKGYNKQNNNNAAGDFIQPVVHLPPSGNNFNFHLTNHSNYSSDIDTTINDYKVSMENSKPSFVNTLIGTRINTNTNKKQSKGYSTPATITICDKESNMNMNPIVQGTEIAFKTVQRQDLVIEKKPERKGTLQNVPALLPEISGKRLEVTNIAHRLL